MTKSYWILKLVMEVTGAFFVPSYPHGYRWGKGEITRLLEDIYTNGNKNYCLQLIVIHRDGNRFELIDGSQADNNIDSLWHFERQEIEYIEGKRQGRSNVF